MKEAKYILRTDLGDTELEFENIRNIGVEEIQSLAGNQWTDYNVHDPGITILEQLCYAITELGYKTSFDIKDLLASQHISPETPDTFFSAAQILEGKPITTTDFRKLLIDRVDGLRDVWIEPLNLNSDLDQIKGMYLALIKISPIRIKTKTDRDNLINVTRCYLEKYSNLGEAFNDIILLEEIQIKVSGEIDLNKETNVDKTHANILYSIQQYISSPIRFYSLEHMIESGYSIEEIFDGPRLFNGFIKDEDLKERLKMLMTSQLINVISEVEGVSKVRFLKIETVNEPLEKNEKSGDEYHHLEDQKHNLLFATGEGVLIDMNKVAVMAHMMIPYHDEAKQTFKYYQNNERVNLYNTKVIRYFRQIEIENAKKVKYTTDYQALNDIAKRKGIEKPIEEYFSVQEHFPEIYAVGSRGIPHSFELVRVNKVKQLKAYLLVFEQILTNYLAQLTNFAHLFSLNEDLDVSYFGGSLSTVPLIRDLLDGLNAYSNDDEVDALSRELSRSSLKYIDDFYARRHKVIDHLLARFGEKVSTFGLDSYNFYYDDNSLEKVKLTAKIKYLKELRFLSSNKARSFNSVQDFWTTDHEKKNTVMNELNISYLEKKVKIRLGMPLQNIRIAEYLNREIGSIAYNEHYSLQELAEYLSATGREKAKCLVFSTVSDVELVKENFEPGIRIDRELLRRGIWVDNFKIITDTEKEDYYKVAFSVKVDSFTLTDYEQEQLRQKLINLSTNKTDFLRFYFEKSKNEQFLIEFERESEKNLTFNPFPKNLYTILNQFQTRKEAEKYVHSLTNYLAFLNINMEGFYLIDHIELRPRTQDDLYGIILRGKEKRAGFISERQYLYVKVQEAFINLVLNARAATFVHKITSDNELETKLIHNGNVIGKYLSLSTGQTMDVDGSEDDILNSLEANFIYENLSNGDVLTKLEFNGIVIGTFLNMNTSQILEALRREDDLKTLFNSLSEYDLHDPAVIQFYSSKDIIKEIEGTSFYSFRVTVVVPSWTSRFDNPEFRKIMENMIREEAPAHIGLDFFYLDYQKLSQFEQLYVEWLNNLKQLSEDSINQINKSANSLAVFIKRLKEAG